MKRQLEQVKSFQQAAGQGTSETPILLSHHTWGLRYELGKEELTEYAVACKNEDLVGIADALADQLYILLGTINAHGMTDLIEHIFDEVHSSNASKIGPDGQVIKRADGKILKPEGYFPPNIRKFVEKYIPTDESDTNTLFSDSN